MGRMASNKGSEIDTPAARKNVRRDSLRRWDMQSPMRLLTVFRPDFVVAVLTALVRSIVEFPGTTYLF